jgi:hypothetical protein
VVPAKPASVPHLPTVAAQAAKSNVSLMPLNVVRLGAPLLAEMDAVKLVSVPYAFPMTLH